jgi:hypothetical protein
VFRNYLRGIRSLFHNQINDSLIDDATQSGNGPKRCIGAMAYSYWMTFVGNVLGAQGQMNGWVYDRSLPDGWSAPGIWLLGWEHELFDSNVVRTAVRDGNWDWVQGRQSWHNASAVALQNSLYLTDKPAFFGDCTWPWVDPSTGAVYTLPAKARYDGVAPCAGATIPIAPGHATQRTFSIRPHQISRGSIVDYSLSAASRVRLEILTISGQRIRTLVDRSQAAASHSCAWNARDVRPGIYVCRLTVDNETMAKRFVLR